MKIKQAMLFLILALQCAGLFSQPAYPGGLAITFDDEYITSWFYIHDILQKYNAKATFFVSQFDTLSDEEIQMLHQLEASGSEIGCHSLNHRNALDVLSTKTVEEYLDWDIIPAIQEMNAHGFFPSSFAYPQGANNAESDAALLKHFDFVRDTAYTNQPVVRDLDEIDEVFFDSTSGGLVAAVGFDVNYHNSLTSIQDGIQRAKTNNEVLLLYGHDPTDVYGTEADMLISGIEQKVPYDRLENILAYCVENGVRFYTVSELKKWKMYHQRESTWRWQTLAFHGSSLDQLAFADFDGNGRTDIFRATGRIWNISYDGITDWKVLHDPAGVTLENLAFADFNGDGKTDVFRIYNNEWHVAYGGTISWQKLNDALVTDLADLAFGYFDSNPGADVFNATGSIWRISSGGSGPWETLQSPAGVTLENLAFGDFNDNGRTDVFHATGSEWLVAYDGVEPWQTLHSPAGVTLENLAFGDFLGPQNENKTDVFTIINDEWKVAEDGVISWQSIGPAGGTTLDDLAFGDFDGDGKTDIFVIEQNL